MVSSHLALSGLALLAQAVRAADVGYLAAAFTGGLEQVYFHLAPASTPQTFRVLNDGQPYLTATTGTRGARDPSVLRAEDGSKLWVLATDLNINESKDWGAAQRTGSRSIHVWESTDGVNWSADRLVELMPATAGYVWAPSAQWDPDTSSYAVFWSSVTFDSADTSHTGASTGPFIWYSHTTDFSSFTSPQRWNPDNDETVIDQEIQHLGGRSYVRYFSDTQQVQRVVADRSDNGLFGTWTRIGIPYDQVREGPASFQDINNPARYYLWEDDYSGAGYQCFYTEDFAVPYQACPTTLSPSGMRHGGVIALDADRYDALDRT